MAGNEGNLLLENVRIIYRNFAGKEGPYNSEGDRNFAVILEDPKLVAAMEKDGWLVKYTKPRDEDDEPQPYLPVRVKFDRGRPPLVVMITSRGRTELDEDSCEVLDWADIRNVDLFVRPYNWSVNGKSGTKAYLKSIYVTIEEDALQLKYADIDDIPSRSGKVDE